jgi:hypothetical protein
MKRLLLIAGAALAAATFVPLAGGSGSSYDYVVGAGERATDDGVPINHFSVTP